MRIRNNLQETMVELGGSLARTYFFSLALLCLVFSLTSIGYCSDQEPTVNTEIVGPNQNFGPPNPQIQIKPNEPIQATSAGVLAVDTVGDWFTSSLEGWHFYTPADQIDKQYPNASCDTVWATDTVPNTFGLSQASFGGQQTLRYDCNFRGYYDGPCKFEWWIKSVVSSNDAKWSGVHRIEARLYKNFGENMWAQILVKYRGNDTLFAFGWPPMLSSYGWFNISLDEPYAGAFADVEAVAIVCGAFTAVGPLYVDYVRGIKNVTVAIPILVSPADGSSTEANFPTFKWQPSAGAVAYDLRVADNSSFEGPIVNLNWYSGTEYTDSSFIPNGTYYWRVQARESDETPSGWSSTAKFQITGPYEVPSEFPTIQAAINAIPIYSGGEVLVAPGTYTGTGNRNLGGFGDKSVQVRSSGGPASTIIDCQALGDGFYFGSYTGAGTVIDGFTISNASGGDGGGGAIDCNSAWPTINNCIVENSLYEAMIVRNGARPTITNSIFRNNDGYGIWVRNGSNVVITDCNFYANRYDGLSLSGATSATVVTGTTFDNTIGGEAGGRGVYVSNSSTPSFTGCTFQNNDGHGLYTFNSSVTLSSCTFSGNGGGWYNGGGMYVGNNSGSNQVTLDNCTFEGNQGNYGGGVYAYNIDIEVLNSLFDGNTAQRRGGAVYINWQSTASVSGCTFVNNAADSGSGFYIESDPNISKDGSGPAKALGGAGISECLFAFATQGEAIFLEQYAWIEIGCTDIYGNAGGDWTGNIAGLLGQDGNISADPLFCDPSSGDYSVSGHSPCGQGVSPCNGIGAFGVGCVVSLQCLAEADPTQGEEPLTVSFQGGASGGVLPYSYRWVYGDGVSSTVKDPRHVYSAEGVYNAELTVTDGQGSVCKSQVTITVGSVLNCSASASPTDGPAPLSVTFDGVASGGMPPYNYNWAFGDDSASADEDPTHVYSVEGVYNAVLTVIDAQERECISQVTITVSAALDCSASASPTEGPAPLSVTFDGGASGGMPPYSFSWAFGDDSASVDAAPTHEYSTEGVYNAVLTVMDAQERECISQVTITVSAALDCSASASPIDGPAPLSVTFDGAASGGMPPYSYSWAFGDDSASVDAAPTHVYSTEGVYNAVLTVIDAQERECTSEVTISVDPEEVLAINPPSLDFDISAADLEFVIENVGTGSVTWEIQEFSSHWLSVTPMSGSFPSGGDDRVSVHVDRSRSMEGVHSEALSITSNSGDGEVSISMYSPIRPDADSGSSGIHIDGRIRIPFNGLADPQSIYDALGIDPSNPDQGFESYIETELYLGAIPYAGDSISVLYIEPDNSGDFSELNVMKVELSQFQNQNGAPSHDAPYEFTFVSGAVVWPGDTDHNGVVDERDVLPLGLYYGYMGPGRETDETDGLDWDQNPALVLDGDEAWQPYRAVYADADGSGDIGPKDICGITRNWSSVPSGLSDKEDERERFAASLAMIDENVLQALYMAVIECPDSDARNSLRESLLALIDQPSAETEQLLPTRVELYQNYPNPFNPFTTISFYLPASGKATLSIYNMLGQRVATLIDGAVNADYVEAEWDGIGIDGNPVASGIYLYRLETGDFSETKRMLLLK